jgi:hypothetical protein
MAPKNRDDFKEYCLRKLGHPVIRINVDDDQVEDRIDEALDFWRQFHYDAVQRTYLKHQITGGDKANGYITISDSVRGISRIFSPSGMWSSTGNIFNLNYQLRLNDLWDLSSSSYSYYGITMMHLRSLDMMFVGEAPIRFNRHTDRLYIDIDWTGKMLEGDYLIAEADVHVDPDTYPDVWTDKMLSRYATALIKQQWATNLKKYGGVQLPGGVVLNGPEMYAEATTEVKELEEEMRLTYEQPPQFLVG